MSYLPVIKAVKLVPILARMGFKVVRQKGSHIHLEHIVDKAIKITIPVHNKDLPRKTLLSILKQGKINVKDFIKAVRKR